MRRFYLPLSIDLYSCFKPEFLFLRMNFLKDPGFVLRISISIAYVVLAVYLFLHPDVLAFLTHNLVYAFSAVIFIYGLFRGYRAILLYKEQHDDEA
jgi:hypothetical protein